MSMGGGSSGSSNQTTTTEPWSEQKPYLEQGFQQAQNIYENGPPQFFPGQTYVDFSPETASALSATANRATSGSPVTVNASGYASNVLGGNSDNPYAPFLASGGSNLAQTAGGNFLNSNPYLDQTYDAAAKKLTDSFSNSVVPTIASQFGASGTTGSALMGQNLTGAGGELTDSLGQLAANIYGGNYQQERDRQVQAATGLTSTGTNLYNTGVNERTTALGLSPTIAGAEYTDAEKLAGVGQQEEQQQERALQDQINRFNFNQNAPLSSLQDYLAMISGNYGSTSTSRGSTSTGSNPLATGIGAAATAASLASGSPAGGAK